MAQSRTGADEFFYVIEDQLRIIYADDDPILREFAKVHMSSNAVELSTVADGRELLALLDHETPDIILLDLEMPNMDGFEVLKHLSDDQALRRIPVIVVTGREDVGAIDRAYKAGATSFVVKPMNWRQLSYQIRYVHRTARNESRLVELERHAVAALHSVAMEGSRFLTSALALDESLRPAAARFASSLNKAVQSRPSVDHQA